MSWDQLLDMRQVALEEAQQRASGPPVACPNDGEPLEEGPEGELHCRFDGWVWDGTNSV